MTEVRYQPATRYPRPAKRWALVAEHKAGWPSWATADVATVPALTDAEIAERMSGNICRCAAYPNIVAAVREVAEGDRQ